MRSVCTEIKDEFRRMIGHFRKEHKKQRKGPYPDVMTISVFGSDVVAATHARHLYIRANAKTTAWIHSGLQCAVKKYTDDALRAASHVTTQADDDLDIQMPSLRIGVRNKVIWKSQQNTWALNVTRDDEKHITHMKRTTSVWAWVTMCMGKNLHLHKTALLRRHARCGMNLTCRRGSALGLRSAN